MGADRQRSTIVSVVSGQGGLLVYELCRVDLVGMCEELPWLVTPPDLNCGNLVHLLAFTDLSQDSSVLAYLAGKFL